MPTLLANPRMDPALVARIEASVTGRRKRTIATRSMARLVSLVRLVVVLGVVGVVVAVVTTRHRDRTEFQAAQQALYRHWQSQSAPLTLQDRAFLANLEASLARFTGNFPGDLVAEELRLKGALRAQLARSSVYIRGPIAAFNASASVAKAAAESGKDGLLLCLLDPPTSSTEKLMLPKARIALGGGVPGEDPAPQVRRLAEAEFGMPYLLPGWGDRVQHAKTQPELLRIERELKKAPIEATKRVLRSELAIAVYDEPNDGGGVTELDGEHAHSIRLVIVELASNKTLLWLRRQVDPSWVTPNRRSQYARELDGCRLAIDIHETVAGPTAAPVSP